MTLGCGRLREGLLSPPRPRRNKRARHSLMVANTDQERSRRGLRSPAEVRNGPRLNDMGRRCRLGLTLGSRCVFRTRGKAGHLVHLADVLWLQITIVREAGGLRTGHSSLPTASGRIRMLGWAWTHGSLPVQSGRRGGLCSSEAAAGSGHVLGLHMMLPCRNCMRPPCQGGKETS